MVSIIQAIDHAHGTLGGAMLLTNKILVSNSSYHLPRHSPVPQMSSQTGNVECWNFPHKAY